MSLIATLKVIIKTVKRIVWKALAKLKKKKNLNCKEIIIIFSYTLSIFFFFDLRFAKLSLSRQVEINVFPQIVIFSLKTKWIIIMMINP